MRGFNLSHDYEKVDVVLTDILDRSIRLADHTWKVADEALSGMDPKVYAEMQIRGYDNDVRLTKGAFDEYLDKHS